MTKLAPIPRLSIVVPVGSDLTAFESTLISVLENQPSHSETIVAHDGTYDDPFDLCDEVRFVTAPTNRIVDLVAAGTSAAHGRFVHVLAGGLRATADWTDAALEKFEHFDAGVVAPVIRDADQNLVMAAGWIDTTSRLCQPASAGRRDASPSASRLIGAYLAASFWRRDLLASLVEAFPSRDELDATYAYESMSRRAGWRCVLANDSDILCDAAHVPGDQTSSLRGKRLRALRGVFFAGGRSVALQSAASAMLANLVRPALWKESLGQAFAPALHQQYAKQIRVRDVAACDEDPTIHRLPARSTAAPSRRVA